MAIVCAVGENLQRGPDAVRAGRSTRSTTIPLRLVSQAASRRNITFVLRDADVPQAMNRLHDEFFATSWLTDGRRMRIAARRPRQDGTAGRAAGAASTAARSPASSIRSRRAHGGARRSDAGATSTSRSTSRRPTPSSTNVPALARRGINVVIGTTGWQAHEADAAAGRRRRRHRRRRGAELLDRRRAVRGDRRAGGDAVRGAGRVRRVAARGASRDEEGRAVGHGAAAEARDGAGRATRGRSTCRRRAPGYIPGTHTIGFDGPAETITLTHTARDRRAFARGALTGRAVGQGQARLVHDARRARD